MKGQTFKTAAEVETFYRDAAPGDPIFRIKGKKGTFVMSPTGFPIDNSGKEIGAKGLFTPYQIHNELGCEKYLRTPDTAKYEKYFLSEYDLKGVDPTDLIFTGKYDRRSYTPDV